MSRCIARLTAPWLVGLALGLATALAAPAACAQAKLVQTPYQPPKVLVDVYLDDPAKMGAALNWLRGVINPLMDSPYNMQTEDMKIIVLMHGAEVVTLARKNFERYHDIVQRMRYYAEQGVKFKVCGLGIKDYGYTPADLYDFVEVAPSAVTDLVYWQSQGYVLLPATVLDKKYSIDEIR